MGLEFEGHLFYESIEEMHAAMAKELSESEITSAQLLEAKLNAAKILSEDVAFKKGLEALVAAEHAAKDAEALMLQDSETIEFGSSSEGLSCFEEDEARLTFKPAAEPWIVPEWD